MRIIAFYDLPPPHKADKLARARVQTHTRTYTLTKSHVIAVVQCVRFRWTNTPDDDDEGYTQGHTPHPKATHIVVQWEHICNAAGTTTCGI